MLYLSRSNISCFTFHATLHNHKTLNVTKYIYIYTYTKDYFLFQPVFILLFSPLPPFLNKSPISNICPCYPYIQSVYTIAIQTGKQHILPPPNCWKKRIQIFARISRLTYNIRFKNTFYPLENFPIFSRPILLSEIHTKSKFYTLQTSSTLFLQIQIFSHTRIGIKI